MELTNRVSTNTPFIHQTWSFDKQIQLIILWGLLIFPIVQQSVAKDQKPQVNVEELMRKFPEYFSKHDFQETLKQFQKHDYIRIKDEKIIAGTKLFCAFDARKMYDFFVTNKKRSTLL